MALTDDDGVTAWPSARLSAWAESRRSRLRTAIQAPQQVCDDEHAMAKKKAAREGPAAQPIPAFDLHTFLDSAGIARKVTKYAKGAVVFSQGDVASDVFYLQHGSIRISVVSHSGKSAVVAVVTGGTVRRRAMAPALSTPRAVWRASAAVRPPRE